MIHEIRSANRLQPRHCPACTAKATCLVMSSPRAVMFDCDRAKVRHWVLAAASVLLAVIFAVNLISNKTKFLIFVVFVAKKMFLKIFLHPNYFFLVQSL